MRKRDKKTERERMCARVLMIVSLRGAQETTDSHAMFCEWNSEFDLQVNHTG